MDLAQTSTVIDVHISADERAMLEAAAEQAHTSLSDFIRRTSMDAAAAAMLQRSTVTIPARDWDAFTSWMDRPAAYNPRLAAQMQLKPVWEE